MERTQTSRLSGTWAHSYEEDEGGVQVYRPYDLSVSAQPPGPRHARLQRCGDGRQRHAGSGRPASAGQRRHHPARDESFSPGRRAGDRGARVRTGRAEGQARLTGVVELERAKAPAGRGDRRRAGLPSSSSHIGLAAGAPLCYSPGPRRDGGANQKTQRGVVKKELTKIAKHCIISSLCC